MNQHAVQLDGDAWPCSALAIGVERGCGEVDIISLPAEWRQAHVEAGLSDGVDTTASVLSGMHTEGVEHLGFPAAIVIDVTIASALISCFGLEWRAKFDVGAVTLEVLFAHGAVGFKQSIFKHSVFPGVYVAAIKQHHSTLRRFGAEGWRFALDATNN